MEAAVELKLLKSEIDKPFSYLIRQAARLLEEEKLILQTSNEREALLQLKAAKLADIQEIDRLLNAEAVTNGTQRIGTIFATANKTEPQNY